MLSFRESDILDRMEQISHEPYENVVLSELRVSDIGVKVRYIPDHAQGVRWHPDCQDGIIKSWNNKWVFVKFIDHSGDTAQACDSRNLIWLPHDGTPMPIRNRTSSEMSYRRADIFERLVFKLTDDMMGKALYVLNSQGADDYMGIIDGWDGVKWIYTKKSDIITLHVDTQDCILYENGKDFVRIKEIGHRVTADILDRLGNPILIYKFRSVRHSSRNFVPDLSKSKNIPGYLFDMMPAIRIMISGKNTWFNDNDIDSLSNTLSKGGYIFNGITHDGDQLIVSLEKMNVKL